MVQRQTCVHTEIKTISTMAETMLMTSHTQGTYHHHVWGLNAISTECQAERNDKAGMLSL